MSKNTKEEERYQGFPYVNVPATEVASLGREQAAELARWRWDLPRKQLTPPVHNGGVQCPAASPSQDKQPPPRVYYIPDCNPADPEPSSPSDEDRPVIYIDIPEGPSSLTTPRVARDEDLPPDSGGRQEEPRHSGSKPDLDAPVTYIDIPLSNGSTVSQVNEEEEPAYVQETILYDPFKDRRIELPRDTDSEGPGSSGVGSSRAPRPVPPYTLNIGPSGSSGSPVPQQNAYLPSYMSQEAYIYGRQPTPNDEFPLSPLPVNEMPAYPPRYEEINGTAPSPSVAMERVQSPITEQPRTQVITPTIPPQIVDGRRKLLTCQHCQVTAQTVVLHESGCLTHFLGCMALSFVCPLVFVVYCCDEFKYKNHYCPGCNKKIGYQSPLTCCSNHLTYVS